MPQKSRKKKYLVISPHPDDSDFGCAGTIAKLAREGHAIEELIVSDGSKGNHLTGFNGKRLAAIRKQEQEASARVLGVQKVHFLGEVDGTLENTERLRKKLVREIRRIKPDIVFTFDPSSLLFENVYRSHRDHRMAAETVFDAIYPAVGNSSFFPELLKEGFQPHQIETIWFFAGPRPNKYVNIAATIDVKAQALSCHKSQFSPEKLADVVSFIRQRAKEAGKRKNMKYAEAFRTLDF